MASNLVFDKKKAGPLRTTFGPKVVLKGLSFPQPKTKYDDQALQKTKLNMSTNISFNPKDFKYYA